MARTPRNKPKGDAARDKRVTPRASGEGAVTDAASGRQRPPGSAERQRRELEERQAPASAEPPLRRSAERRRREFEERQAALAATEAPRPPARRRRERRPPPAQDARQTAAQPGGRSGAQPNDMLSRWLDSQDGDLRAFVASRTAQMDQRRYQLSLIKDFVDDPTRFGIKPGDVPTSTTPAEFAERRSELEYRINMVRTFLDLLNDELRLLEQAEAYAREQAGASES